MFDNIKYNQILNLLKITCRVKDHNFDFVRSKFLTESENFENVLDLLIKIKLVVHTKNKLYPNSFLVKKYSQNNENNQNLKGYFIDKLLNSKSVYSKESQKYLENFKLGIDDYTYNPPTNKRLKESAIRNLFIELDFVLYDSKKEIYKINPLYYGIHEKSIVKSHKCISLKSLNLTLKKQEEIGRKAEETILEYEKLSLKSYPNLVKSIQHISQTDVQAGFDIKSWSLKSNSSQKVRKFIEVKAVSDINYEFKWTRNEIDTSKKYKYQYFLYLLPCANNKFDLSSLKIIQNPYNEIFGDGKRWKNQIEEYNIWRIN